MTLWKGRDGSYASVIFLWVRVQDLPTRVSCRTPVTSQSRALTGTSAMAPVKRQGLLEYNILLLSVSTDDVFLAKSKR